MHPEVAADNCLQRARGFVPLEHEKLVALRREQQLRAVRAARDEAERRNAAVNAHVAHGLESRARHRVHLHARRRRDDHIQRRSRRKRTHGDVKNCS